MNIALITSLKSTPESKRIMEELQKMGHTAELVYVKETNFSIENGQVTYLGLFKNNYDVVIVRDILVSIKELSVTLKHLQTRGTKIFDNNLSSTLYSINKTTDLLKLAYAGVSIPNTYYTRDFEDYFTFKERLTYPFIVKRTSMGKGAGIYKIDNDAALQQFIDSQKDDPKAAKKFIMQQFIPYVHDLRVLIVGDQVFAMKRTPAEGDFRANFSLGGSVEVFNIDDETRDLAFKALNAMGMSYGGVDVLIDENNKKYILEVNHNAGFAGMEKATGKNIGKLYIEYAIENAK